MLLIEGVAPGPSPKKNICIDGMCVDLNKWHMLGKPKTASELRAAQDAIVKKDEGVAKVAPAAAVAGDGLALAVGMEVDATGDGTDGDGQGQKRSAEDAGLDGGAALKKVAAPAAESAELDREGAEKGERGMMLCFTKA